MNDPRDGTANPGIMFDDRDKWRDFVKMERGVHRRQDPGRQEAQLQALQRVCASENECNDTLAAIREHERRTNTSVRVSDLPAIVEARRERPDTSIESVIREQEESRTERRRPTVSASQEDEELRSQPQPYRPDKPRGEGFQTLADRTEAKIVSMGLDPEQEKTVREILAEVRSQGPNSPGQVERYSEVWQRFVGEWATSPETPIFTI